MKGVVALAVLTALSLSAPIIYKVECSAPEGNLEILEAEMVVMDAFGDEKGLFQEEAAVSDPDDVKRNRKETDVVYISIPTPSRPPAPAPGSVIYSPPTTMPKPAPGGAPSKPTSSPKKPSDADDDSDDAEAEEAPKKKPTKGTPNENTELPTRLFKPRLRNSAESVVIGAKSTLAVLVASAITLLFL